MSALTLNLHDRTTSGLTDSSSTSTTDDDFSQDRLAAQIAKIMKEVRKELSCSHKHTHKKCRPERLAQILEVFRHAIPRNDSLVTEENHMLMQHFTMQCMDNYTRENCQLSNRLALANQDSRHRMVERDNAVKALENLREFPEIDRCAELSQSVKEFASTALSKIKETFEARSKCLKIEKERIEFFKSLLILKTRLLAHPWSHEKVFQSTFRQIKTILLDVNANPQSPPLSNSKHDVSPTHPTPSSQKDNLPDQMTKIATEVRQELNSSQHSSSEKCKVRPDHLANMLEVFTNAIQNNANQVPKKICDEMLKFVDHCMSSYAIENRQFSEQFTLAVNENWDRMQERAKGITALTYQLEASDISQIHAGEVENLASCAIDKIYQAFTARTKLMRLANEGIDFLTGLKKLKTVMLAHPWYHFESFQSALKEIRNIEQVGKLEEVESQRSSGLFSPHIKNN